MNYLLILDLTYVILLQLQDGTWRFYPADSTPPFRPHNFDRDNSYYWEKILTEFISVFYSVIYDSIIKLLSWLGGFLWIFVERQNIEIMVKKVGETKNLNRQKFFPVCNLFQISFFYFNYLRWPKLFLSVSAWSLRMMIICSALLSSIVTNRSNSGDVTSVIHTPARLFFILLLNLIKFRRFSTPILMGEMPRKLK